MLVRNQQIQDLERKFRVESLMRALLGFIVMFGSLGGVPLAWGQGLSDRVALIVMLVGALVGAWLIGSNNVTSGSHQGATADDYRRQLR